MIASQLWHKELRENFARVSNEVNEYMGFNGNLTKIDTDEAPDGSLFISLPLCNDFEYSKENEIEFKKDVKLLEKMFGISLI